MVFHLWIIRASASFSWKEFIKSNEPNEWIFQQSQIMTSICLKLLARTLHSLFFKQLFTRANGKFASQSVWYWMNHGDELTGIQEIDSQKEIEKAKRNFHQLARAKAHLHSHKLPSPTQIDFEISSTRKGFSLYLFSLACEFARKESFLSTSPSEIVEKHVKAPIIRFICLIDILAYAWRW